MIGTTIGRYRVVSKLGEGGMGSVWLAEDPVLGRSVALKVLPEASADSPEARERLLREARAACRLHHAGIATVYEAGEDDGRIYLAFEHVDGETLAQRVQREGPLPEDEALRIAREVAEALGHAHDRGVLHRDVTSGNVMLDSSGRAKLVDFGLAYSGGETRLTRPASTPGTIGYVAPEIVKGAHGDRRADLYGLGVVLYEMLTGRLPFERHRAEAVLYAVANEKPEPPRRHRPDLPVEMEAFVLRALAKDPAQRFADTRELIEALEGGAPPRAATAPRFGSSRGVVLLALPLAALAAMFLWHVSHDADGRYESVALLPLELLGPNAEESAYLATGLADALVNRLGRVSDLRVTPWVTSRRYPPHVLPLPDIASELNVESLVVGSFHEDNGMLRVELSLFEAGSRAETWSETFEDTKIGLLELQEEITLAVANSLRRGLTPEEETVLIRRPTDRADAYDHYLRGAAALQAGTRDGSEQALARFETALAIDPSLAEAHVGVGAVLALRYEHGWAGEEGLTMAEESFRRALQIQPDLLAAHRGLIRVLNNRGGNEMCLRIAREIREMGEVSVDALLAQGEGMLLGGLPDEAVPLLETVRRLDPTNEASQWLLVYAHGQAGDFAKAIEAGEQYLWDFTEDAVIHFFIAGSHLCMENEDDARAHYERSRELASGDVPSWVYCGMAGAIRKLDGEDQARDWAREGIRQLESQAGGAAGNTVLGCDLARLYSIVGDTAKVLEHGRRLRERDGAWCSISEAYQLVLAYAEIGDEETANELLREQAERLRSASTIESSSSESDGPYFDVHWLRGCNIWQNAGPWQLRHLPAFDDVMEALRQEEVRRRALYGG